MDVERPCRPPPSPVGRQQVGRQADGGPEDGELWVDEHKDIQDLISLYQTHAKQVQLLDLISLYQTHAKQVLLLVLVCLTVLLKVQVN